MRLYYLSFLLLLFKKWELDLFINFSEFSCRKTFFGRRFLSLDSQTYFLFSIDWVFICGYFFDLMMAIREILFGFNKSVIFVASVYYLSSLLVKTEVLRLESYWFIWKVFIFIQFYHHVNWSNWVFFTTINAVNIFNLIFLAVFINIILYIFIFLLVW